MGCRRLGHGAGAVFVLVAGGSSLAAAPGLIAAYGFEENTGSVTADVSGNGFTAAILPGTAWTTAGKFGSALVFDGSTAGVTVVPDAPALRLTTAVTLEAWVKPSSVLSQWTDVVQKGNDNYFLMSATPTAGRPAAGGTFGGTNAFLVGASPLPVGTWSHLASTYDGARLRLYVNGVQVASVNRTGTLATSAFPLQIGGDGFFEQRFAGTIDEVRVYNRALTATEIQSDMSTPLVAPVTDTTSPTAPGPPSVTAFSGTSLSVAWGAASDDVAVARYRLERCRGTGCTDFQVVASPEGTSFKDTGLALHTHYTYRVAALDAAGLVSPPSGVAGATTLSTPVVPGLVAAYGFETGSGGTVTDASGNGNAGTIAGATWTSGRYGNALFFNGTNATVNVPDAPSLRLTTALTLSAWVKLSALGPSEQWVDVVYKGVDSYYILASSDMGQLPEMGGILDSGKHILFGARRVTLGTWTHLALTYDGAALRVYQDGLLVRSSPQTGAFITSARPLQMGGDDDYGQHLTGTIDEVRVYDRALAAEEIQADLATPVQGATNPTPSTISLAPSTAMAGGAGLSLDVAGTGFTPSSIVLWDDAPRATLFVSPTLLRATTAASDVSEAGSVPVTVFNAPPIGGTSNAQTLTLCAGSTWYRDADGDGHGDSQLTQASCAQPAGFVAASGDCNDADATVWGSPGEAEALALNDRQTLTWFAPSSPGGTSLRYDTIRAEAPNGFETAGTCIETGGEDTVSTDTSTPPGGSVFFYLVRARNDCGEGSAGRPAAACP